ncbi:hypothetical protein LCGC14_2497290 [marine sediment metagenome]|uniref:Uncharacterized protein n=1 Tax=marine sediment metagenome TaxID=412755 RepID=A0A0F9BQZ1_9ZZZZ
MTYKVVNDPSNIEPSYIKVVDEDNNILVYLHGSMSMAAAGSFIERQKEENSDIHIALSHWEEEE